jgi:hypothetical protein
VARGDAVAVLGRSEAKITEIFGSSVEATTIDGLTEARMRDFDAVVNLAGENIGNALRWSDATVQEIRQSRVNLTMQIAKLITASKSKARLLNASAIAVYGYEDETAEDVKDEEAALPERSVDVLTEVCANWEKAAREGLPDGHPLVLMRIGVVLAQGAGALGKMELPFRLGMGGRMGSGQQGLSWISLADMVGAVRFLLDHPEIVGPANVTAGFVRQAAFAQALASALHRPCLVPAPGFAVRLLLGRYMADALVFCNYRIQAKKLSGAGYDFADKDITLTLANIYSGTSCLPKR